MTLKIEVSVKVYESGKSSYKDPNGYEEVTLVCHEGNVTDLLQPVDGIASALLKVAHLNYLSKLAEEKEDE